MTLQEFIDKYKGKKDIGNTPQNKGECVGLVMVYLADKGLPHIWGNAKDIFYNASPLYFEKIVNSLTAYPEAGDIVVWNENVGGGFGHTAIATGKNNGDAFEVLEQNNPTGVGVRLHTYRNYANVIGWLKPKLKVEENNMDIKKAVQFDRVLNFLKDKGYITDNDSRHYLEGEFLELIKGFYEDYGSQRERAHLWDKAVNLAYLTPTDSKKVTPEMLKTQFQSAVAGKNEKLAEELASAKKELEVVKEKYYKLLSDITNLLEKYKNEA